MVVIGIIIIFAITIHDLIRYASGDPDYGWKLWDLTIFPYEIGFNGLGSIIRWLFMVMAVLLIFIGLRN
ncbi:MAG TPA: hypothetical protein VLE72_02995 [Candidatus Saccharimonadales bacterium]|nr:hypothetical protein [Candidatus Saccharimonadales bacterium]